MKYLLKQNVDADAKNINNQTALHNACFKGAHEIVKTLLKHGVSYDSKNLDGDCPAHLTVKGMLYTAFASKYCHKKINKGNGQLILAQETLANIFS